MVCEQHFRIKKNGKPNSICYCRHPELIENYDKAIADTTQTWEVHHRKEEFYSYAELIERGEYFDVQPEELIFLTPSEHHKIDSFCKRRSDAQKGKKLSEETKRKLSDALKGKPTWNKGKHLSDEHKQKMSDALKGKHWKLVDGKRVWY